MKTPQPVENSAADDQAALPTPETVAANNPEPSQATICDSTELPEDTPEALGLVTDFITVRLEGDDLSDDDVPDFDRDPHEACPICHEPNSWPSDLSNAGAMIKLPCGHTFGWQCLTSWVSAGKENCPMCRRPCRYYVDIECDDAQWTRDRIHAGLAHIKPEQKPDFNNCNTRRHYEKIWIRDIVLAPAEKKIAAISRDRLVRGLAAVIVKAISDNPSALHWWVHVYIKLRAGIDRYWHPSVTEEIRDSVWGTFCEMGTDLQKFSSIPDNLIQYLPWVLVEVWQMASYS
ncbi:hypothetical protein H2201_002826 [Coniosporium apollinis]|uniref:RING-type domain-containing protein n=1 Tax=Coniosporium apollinis TaxID=61459 RepID=A0ABQ9NZ44_9PEZI|nr:hypothetical protein H2201_002826 [Coniosporium apollinis]